MDLVERMVSATINQDTDEVHVAYYTFDEHGAIITYVKGKVKAGSSKPYSLLMTQIEYEKAQIAAMKCRNCGFTTKYVHEWIEHGCEKKKELEYLWG